MGCETSRVHCVAQRVTVCWINQTGKVHDHVFPTPHHFRAYVGLQKEANVKRWVGHIIARAFDIPVLPGPVSTITVTCAPRHWPRQLTCLHQGQNRVCFAKRSNANLTATVRVRGKLELPCCSSSRCFRIQPGLRACGTSIPGHHRASLTDSGVKKHDPPVQERSSEADQPKQFSASELPTRPSRVDCRLGCGPSSALEAR